MRRTGAALALCLTLTAQAADLPGRYYRLLDAGIRPVEAVALTDLKTLEQRPGWRHFPSAILAAAVLYTKDYAANSRHRDPKMLDLARRIGDLLVAESNRGTYQQRLDHHRDTYLWLEACRLLEQDLGPERLAAWRRELEKNIAGLAAESAVRVDFPWYNSPYIRTSPNHFSLWASTTYLAGRVFQKSEWEAIGARIMHRFAAEEQTPDGYWGEHSRGGPTPGYDYLTMSAVAVYQEHSRDPAALQALRRSTDFHKYFTWPDGTPVDVINDRNRRWAVSDWGQFGFSHFADGRRYAEFLTSFKREETLGMESLGRIAQNALYYHDGPTEPIPQDQSRYAHQMTVPAGIRKTGPWVVCLSGLIATQAVDSQFYLDRQGNVSVFHEKLGLIITGANSKRQPELATFREKHLGQIFHLPMSSRLQMSSERDRLSLSFHTFFSDVEVPQPSDKQATLRFSITGKGRPPDHAQLALQLVLKAGEIVETAAGRWTLGPERLEMGPEQLGGWIRHHGWTLQVDPSARLTWPVYPFNPYANAPETDLAYAVGALTVPLQLKGGGGLRPREQEIEFKLGVD